jgi:gamma-glutamyl-gamma-aminobutyrate hydrolase PuuD
MEFDRSKQKRARTMPQANPLPPNAALAQVFQTVGPQLAGFLPAQDLLNARRLSRNVTLAATPQQVRNAVKVVHERKQFEAFRAVLAANNEVNVTRAANMRVVIVDGNNRVQGAQPLRSPASRAKVAALVSHAIENRRRKVHSPVTIVHREEGRGTGAFWDHYTTQKMTGRPTLALHPAEVKPTIVSHVEGTEKRGHNYRGAMPVTAPSTISSEFGSGSGLLMIAGTNVGLESEQPRRHREHTPTREAAVRHSRREQLERELLREARLTGRPVLAVCGGSWRLLEAYGGQTRLVDANTHQSRVMPFLRADGLVGGGSHIREHGLRIGDDRSVLSAAMQSGTRTNLPTSVNSVHWAVADERRRNELTGVARLPSSSLTESGEQMLQVTARGVTSQRRPYPGLSQAELQERHRYAVEAFETRHGAPMLGLQWHPEAYNPNQPEYHANRNVLNFMAGAGDAYEARRSVTRRFEFIRGLLAASGLPLTPQNVAMMSRQLAKLEGQ